MRMKMAEKNVEVMNKINGAVYCITSVENGKAYAQEILEKEPEQKLAEEKVVFCQALFPEKSVGIPFFYQGIFPVSSGHYASLRIRACSIR